MKLEFDIQNVIVTEFGVGRDEDDGQAFVAVSVDGNVQAALHKMVQATWQALQIDDDGPSKYQPSEKHASTECLYLPLGDDLASVVRELHEAANLAMDGHALDDPTAIYCYFARLTDNKGLRLTALRRATQFKGIVKSRLIRFVTDALKLIEDRVFKLDTDFDLLVDAKNVHILRPSGFEFVGKLQQAILDAVAENIKAIGKDLAFVEFNSIEAYAAGHPRAARYLASIRAQTGIRSIDKALLKNLCMQTDVEVTDSNGMISVASGHEMGFLEVLDRRRYELELVKGQPERFKASGRKKING